MIQQFTDFEVESYEALDASDTLDLFSTSPTRHQDLCSFHRCAYNAPCFAVARSDKRYRVVQGCCNHWDCPKCGIQVARKHYGRIVAGAREINETCDLWFITVTCRGKEVSVEEAKAKYLEWTSKFLDALYSSFKRRNGDWFYVQVTELQKRGHPHSHILTSFYPVDLYFDEVDNWKRGNDGVLRNVPKTVLRSDFLAKQVVRSNLGAQYDISRVKSVEAASRYVAKYMFKDAQFKAHYPKHWKRVRYSQDWPELERKKTDAFALISAEDWKRLASTSLVIDAESGDAFESASHFMRGHDVILHEIEANKEKTAWQQK